MTLLLDDTLLNVTGYLYRRNDFALADRSGTNQWVSHPADAAVLVLEVKITADL